MGNLLSEAILKFSVRVEEVDDDGRFILSFAGWSRPLGQGDTTASVSVTVPSDFIGENGVIAEGGSDRGHSSHSSGLFGQPRGLFGAVPVPPARQNHSLFGHSGASNATSANSSPRPVRESTSIPESHGASIFGQPTDATSHGTASFRQPGEATPTLLAQLGDASRRAGQANGGGLFGGSHRFFDDSAATASE